MRMNSVRSLAAAIGLAASMAAAVAQSTPPAPQAPVTPEPAQSAPGPRGGALAACRGDIATLCAGIKRGGGGVAQCLVENKAKASPECQAAIDTVAKKRDRQAAGGSGPAKAGRPLAACQTDLATFCSGSLEKPAKCLNANRAKLSPECQSALQAVAAVRTKVGEACKADAASLCGADAGKPGKLVQCLRTNQAKVSAGCNAVLAEIPARAKKAVAQ